MTAPPPWAVLAWADETAIYVELPHAQAFSRITFPLSESGLTKALTFLRAHQPKAPRSTVHHRAEVRVEAKEKLAALGFRL